MGGAKRPAGDGAHVLLELVDLTAVEGPVAAVVHPGGDLVDQEAAIDQLEHFDADDADIVELAEDAGGDHLGLGADLGG